MSSSKIRSRGRPRGFEEDAAIESAMMTFWRNGYAGTSLDDLVSATGASRASLYAVYGDKRAIFEKCLALYGSRFAERIDAALAAPAAGRERLSAVLNASADRLTGGLAPPGCLRCAGTLELMGVDPDLDVTLRRANEAFTANLVRILERASRDEELPAGRVHDLALFFTAVVNGMVALARGGASREALQTVIASAMAVWPTTD